MNSNTDSFSLQKAGKLLRFPGGLIKFSQRLKNDKYLMDDGEPYQRFIDLEYFIYVKKTLKAANKTVCAPRVTIKGLEALRRHFKKTKTI